MNFVIASNVGLVESSTWSSNLTGVRFSSLALGDINNDGDLDLALLGCNGGAAGGNDCDDGVWAKIYINNGTSLIENQTWQGNLTGAGFGSIAFGDIDNDGDLDLGLVGCTVSASLQCTGDRIAKIYINNGTSLVESNQWEQNLTGTFNGALTWGDINNDGKLDLSLVGQTASSYISKIYLNNGTGLVESNQWEQNLTGVYQGEVAFGDIDNDGRLDLALTGDTGVSKITKIYINNGISLVEGSIWSQSLLGVDRSSLAFGDFDNDGDLDLDLIGQIAGDYHYIYSNNGTTFVENQSKLDQLIGIYRGSIAFGDYDNDGDLDLAAIGKEHGYARVYENNNSYFVQDAIAHANISDEIIEGSLIWGDIDNDNDLDLLISGLDFITTLISKVYISNASLTRNNTKPNPPNSSFSANYVNNILTLSWGNGSDAETNTSGLYYNLMAGNSTKNNTIVSGIYGGSSNPTAGYFGNMMQRKSIALNVQLQANKTYYWYVQTIDTGLAKSNWSAVQNFTTTLDVTKPNITINYPSPNSSLHTTNPIFIFNATVTDANLTNVTLYADWTGSMIANGTNSSGLNGTYTFNRNLTNYADGQYSWYIEANDSSNNSQTSGTRSFYLDRAYPIVRLISPTNGQSWTSSSTVTFSYNVTDTDIANCSLIIDGIIDQADTSIDEDITQTFTKSLSNGNYNWQINCTDYVGYTNSSSTYSLTVSYTAPSGNGGGGGGGGAGTTSFWSQTYAVSDKEFKLGYTKELAEKQRISIKINNESHYVGLVELTNTTATINVSSIQQQATLNIEEEKKFEVTYDNFYDIYIKLNSINATSNKANLTIKSIHEEIPTEEKKKAEEKKEEKKEEIEGKKNILKSEWFWLVVVVVIIFVSIKFLRRYIKYKEWRKYSFVE